MAHFDIGNRLAIYGWKHETEEFFFLLAKIWYTKGFKDNFRNVEQLLFHPIDGSLSFIEEVRKETKIKITDDEILQTLMNLRKNKYLERIEKFVK